MIKNNKSEEIKMKINNENKKNIIDWLKENDIKPINLEKLIQHFKNRNYLKTSDEVLFENIDHFEINVPDINFLDKDYIVNNDEDYIQIGYDKYLNQFLIIEEIEKLYELNLIKNNG